MTSNVNWTCKNFTTCQKAYNIFYNAWIHYIYIKIRYYNNAICSYVYMCVQYAEQEKYMNKSFKEK